jgi:antitoxin component YwqK of YwqJK toxin-antitoxin module
VIKYYDNGKVRLVGFTQNDTYDSTFTSYYENGNKRTEGIFKKCTYKTSSTVIVQSGCGYGRDTTEPRLGIQNGQWKTYYENGQLKSIENYYCNIRVGQWIYYDSLGRLLENEFYNAGGLVQRQSYSDNGKLISFSKRKYQEIKQSKKDNAHNVTYVDDIMEYYETGELKSVKTVNEDNELMGSYIEYWKNGFVKTQGEYKQDKKNGVFREYYENGNTKFEGIIKDDIPQGKQYYSNEKGKNIKIEIWKKSKLIRTEEKSGS